MNVVVVKKPKDDTQQYGIITRVITKPGKKASKRGDQNNNRLFYTVQCYGDTKQSRTLRKCHIIPRQQQPTTLNNDTTPDTSSHLQSVALAVNDVVLVEHKGTKTGVIIHGYNRTEKVTLRRNVNDFGVPTALVRRLKDEGCEHIPDVSFFDDAVVNE